LNATVTADPAPKEEAELLDAMIEHRLAAQGKVLVDTETMAQLKKVMTDLNDALGGLDR